MPPARAGTWATCSLKGELVRLQMRKKKVPTDSKEIRNILRIATPDDEERWEAVRDLETGTMFRARAMVSELRLRMKLSDVEYQADRTRALFYYSAEDRVDFRELIRRLADEFRVRVEMRQISLRQEAGRIGGIGVCGRELCCSTWLHGLQNREHHRRPLPEPEPEPAEAGRPVRPPQVLPQLRARRLPRRPEGHSAGAAPAENQPRAKPFCRKPTSSAAACGLPSKATTTG